MLEVEPTGQRGRVAETTTTLSPAPLQKHLLGGCTVEFFTSNCHRRGHIVSLHDT